MNSWICKDETIWELPKHAEGGGGVGEGSLKRNSVCILHWCFDLLMASLRLAKAWFSPSSLAPICGQSLISAIQARIDWPHHGKLVQLSPTYIYTFLVREADIYRNWMRYQEPTGLSFLCILHFTKNYSKYLRKSGVNVLTGVYNWALKYLIDNYKANISWILVRVRSGEFRQTLFVFK